MKFPVAFTQGAIVTFTACPCAIRWTLREPFPAKTLCGLLSLIGIPFRRHYTIVLGVDQYLAHISRMALKCLSTICLFSFWALAGFINCAFLREISLLRARKLLSHFLPAVEVLSLNGFFILFLSQNKYACFRIIFGVNVKKEKYKKNKIRTFRKVTDKKLLVPNLEQHAIQHT